MYFLTEWKLLWCFFSLTLTHLSCACVKMLKLVVWTVWTTANFSSKTFLCSKPGQFSMHGNTCQIHYIKVNSPQQEDASGRQVFWDMWAFHSSVLGQGCLHHFQPGTHRWPHYGLHYGCTKEGEKKCDHDLSCFLKIMMLYTLNVWLARKKANPSHSDIMLNTHLKEWILENLSKKYGNCESKIRASNRS